MSAMFLYHVTVLSHMYGLCWAVVRYTGGGGGAAAFPLLTGKQKHLLLSQS